LGGGVEKRRGEGAFTVIWVDHNVQGGGGGISMFKLNFPTVMTEDCYSEIFYGKSHLIVYVTENCTVYRISVHCTLYIYVLSGADTGFRRIFLTFLFCTGFSFLNLID